MRYGLIIVLVLWCLSGCDLSNNYRGGYLLFEFLCYENVDHFAVDGYYCDSVPSRACDPFFEICITNKPIKDNIQQERCSVFYLHTTSYDNFDKVCNSPSDNRGSLATVHKRDLPQPIPAQYFVYITVRDADSHGEADIARFSSQIKANPAANMGNPTIQTYIMAREETHYKNNRAALRINVGFQCDTNFYGQACEKWCKASSSDTYTCATNGNKICKTGWLGQECNEKDDCLNIKCAPNVKCLIISNQAKCVCNNGFGPECYSDYNPCFRNPCKNGGTCRFDTTNERKYSCFCPSFFSGSTCETQIDLCQLEPCKNNGTCFWYSNNTRYCECPPGFDGVLCDHEELLMTTEANSVNSTAVKAGKANHIVVIAVILTVLVLVCTIFLGFYYWNMEKRKRRFEIPQNYGDLKKRLDPPDPKAKDDAKSEEGLYEMVEDGTHYSCIIEDGYLLPRNSPSPLTPISKTSASQDYLPMLNYASLSMNNNERKLSEPNEYLPPLPTRDFKRKLSFSILCTGGED